jgi:hypothetical protein
MTRTRRTPASHSVYWRMAWAAHGWREGDTVRPPHQVFLRRQGDQEASRGRHSCLMLHALSNVVDCPALPLTAAVILDDYHGLKYGDSGPPPSATGDSPTTIIDTALKTVYKNQSVRGFLVRALLRVERGLAKCRTTKPGVADQLSPLFTPRKSSSTL